MANRLNVQNIYASDSDTTAALTISSTDGISAPGLVGMIAAFAMSTAPSGWLVCNGGEYAIADYGDLYTAISTTWGSLTNGSGGAGSTHFVVPDLRGEFLRGFDNGAGNDPDYATRTVGSSQVDAGRNATGTANVRGTQGGFDTFSGAFKGDGANSTYPSSLGGTGSQQLNLDLSQSWGASHTSTEFRPRNKMVQYCIKY